MTRGYAAAIEINKVGNPEAVAVVLRAMEALDLPLHEPLPKVDLEVRRFSSDGAVVVRATTASVFIGGTLIGVFDTDDDNRGPRNVLAVTLAKSDQFHLGRLASAFGITDEYLRRLRRREETEGLGAVLGLRQGKTSKVTPELRTAWCAMFEAGRMPVDVYREQPRKHRLSHATVGRVFQEWQRERASTTTLALTVEATAEAAGARAPGGPEPGLFTKDANCAVTRASTTSTSRAAAAGRQPAAERDSARREGVRPAVGDRCRLVRGSGESGRDTHGSEAAQPVGAGGEDGGVAR